MAYMALYRKWRPQTFDDVVEQRHIVTTIKNSIKNNAISHAYLFCGTRGTGKTTLAEIFARAINCLEPKDGSPCNQCAICKGILDGSVMDVIEMDAASNNGVDDVREMKEAVMYVPAVTKYKVYIIDEVHMLSTGAFNALLKTLEEPPQNVVFILATTEPHKLPATVLSRCQRFDFKRITISGLVDRLKLIAEDCGVSFEESALQLIARLSEGGMRDAISLLDQCLGLGKKDITRHDVIEISGLTASQTVNSLAEAIVGKNAQQALQAIKVAMDEGRDLQALCTQLIDWFRNLMLFKTGGEALNMIEISDEELEPIRDAAKHISQNQVIQVIKELSEAEGRLKWSQNQRILLEVVAVKLCSDCYMESKGNESNASKDLEYRIKQLEQMICAYKPEDKGQVKTDRNSAQENRKKPVILKDEPHVKGTENLAIKKGAGQKHLEKWPDIIEYIRKSGKMKIYAYLLDTSCMVLGEGSVAVIVPEEDGLKKTVLSRNDSLEVIKEGLLKVVGLEADIKIIDDKALNNQPNPVSSDPVLKKIKQLADENNIPLDIHD